MECEWIRRLPPRAPPLGVYSLPMVPRGRSINKMICPPLRTNWTGTLSELLYGKDGELGLGKGTYIMFTCRWGAAIGPEKLKKLLPKEEKARALLTEKKLTVPPRVKCQRLTSEGHREGLSGYLEDTRPSDQYIANCNSRFKRFLESDKDFDDYPLGQQEILKHCFRLIYEKEGIFSKEVLQKYFVPVYTEGREFWVNVPGNDRWSKRFTGEDFTSGRVPLPSGSTPSQLRKNRQENVQKHIKKMEDKMREFRKAAKKRRKNLSSSNVVLVKNDKPCDWQPCSFLGYASVMAMERGGKGGGGRGGGGRRWERRWRRRRR